MTGTIKWFSGDRGYGFIQGDDGEEMFFHYSAFPGGHTREFEPLEGKRVSYDVATQDDGRTRAANVDLI